MDVKKLTELFNSCEKELALYARQWVASGDAQDVVQEAFIRLMRQAKWPEKPRQWLYSVVRNGAIDKWRKENRHKKLCQNEISKKEEWFEPRLDDLMDARTAQTALETLEPDIREVVVLRIWGQLSMEEISKVTKKPVSTLYHYYRTALDRLKTRMEKPCQTKMT